MMRSRIPYGRLTKAIALGVLALMPLYSGADTPQVALDASMAGPRAIESLTERSIVRDYRFAWVNLAQALESNSTASLNGLFAGTANDCLTRAVNNQRHSGLSSRYLNQSHKLEAVFYGPEGDVVELHDNAEFDLQILDRSRTIHSEHVTVRYVVLMTPSADRWVIRQLQAVPQF